MKTIERCRSVVGIAVVGAMLAAASTAAADKGSISVRQAANPLAFNLNTEPITLGPFLIGGGLLDRTREAVHVTGAVTGLSVPNAPYTAWWVVFNNPEACVGGFDCGPSDLTNPAANVAVFHATGFFSDSNGAASFSAHLESGPLTDGTDVFLNDGDGVGLERKNGLAAEIHIVIRGHGVAADPNDGLLSFTVADQISLFNGGCVEAFGDPLDNCEDEQVLIFPAP